MMVMASLCTTPDNGWNPAASGTDAIENEKVDPSKERKLLAPYGVEGVVEEDTIHVRGRRTLVRQGWRGQQSTSWLRRPLLSSLFFACKIGCMSRPFISHSRHEKSLPCHICPPASLLLSAQAGLFLASAREALFRPLTS